MKKIRLTSNTSQGGAGFISIEKYQLALSSKIFSKYLSSYTSFTSVFDYIFDTLMFEKNLYHHPLILNLLPN